MIWDSKCLFTEVNGMLFVCLCRTVSGWAGRVGSVVRFYVLLAEFTFGTFVRSWFITESFGDRSFLLRFPFKTSLKLCLMITCNVSVATTIENNELTVGFPGRCKNFSSGAMSAHEEKYRLVNDTERVIDRYRNIVFYFTFIAYANSHLSRKCYTNLKV